jgi:hypothetical protein
MLCAGIAAAVAGVLASLAVADRWVHLTVTEAPTELEEGQVLQLTLRAGGATIGTIATALAIALIAFGAVWFCFGLQRGWTMPGITNPLIAMLVAIAGMATAYLASMVWYVWEEAMIQRSHRAGLSAHAMRDLLDRQPNPDVAIERLSGLVTFGGMMALGLLIACFAWWAYRRRDG